MKLIKLSKYSFLALTAALLILGAPRAKAFEGTAGWGEDWCHYATVDNGPYEWSCSSLVWQGGWVWVTITAYDCYDGTTDGDTMTQWCTTDGNYLVCTENTESDGCGWESYTESCDGWTGISGNPYIKYTPVHGERTRVELH